MTFVIQYEFAPENRNAAQARFKQTGGLPPQGAKMLARWHRIGGLGGYVIAETNDAEALGRWMNDWTDLISFRIDPVTDDETISRILA